MNLSHFSKSPIIREAKPAQSTVNKSTTFINSKPIPTSPLPHLY